MSLFKTGFKHSVLSGICFCDLPIKLRVSAKLGKFNIYVHWFLCMQNAFAHMFVHLNLCADRTAGASLHRLIHSMLIDIVFPVFCHHLTLKNISQGYVQHKGFSSFN